jgi:hypothetical protein
MAWNRSATILPSSHGAEQDADVIFTAALVGLAIAKYRENQTFRIAMEPEIEEPALDKRTQKDLASMKNHNSVCGFVNQMIAFYQQGLGKTPKEAPGTVSWGFCPTFTAGGMIAGGEDAKKLYEDIKLDPGNVKKGSKTDLAETALAAARMYLTEGSKPTGRVQVGDTYIGPGAYCGLVVANANGDAVAAMDTLRTTIKPEGNPAGWLNKQIGDRWCPSQNVEQRRPDKEWLWGMIDTLSTQENCRQWGMKFYPQETPKPEVVGYTHGLPRAVYECMNFEGHSPYEMSIGVKTFKLASCMGCSFFMIANGYEPSDSHLGGALSWIPLYHGEGHISDPLIETDVNDPAKMKRWLMETIQKANDTWADQMTIWLTTGAKALNEAVTNKWVETYHVLSVNSLNELLKTSAEDCVDKLTKSNRYACCNLVLDAFTWHKKDVARVLDTLRWGTPTHEVFTDKGWWQVGAPNLKRANLYPDQKPYQNPYTDQEVKELVNLAALDIKAKAKAKGV